MVTEILGFTAFIVLVFGGILGAVVKFKLTGDSSAKVTQRVSAERFDDVIEQLESDIEAQQKGYSAVQSRKNSKNGHDDSDGKGSKMPHVMA